MSDSRKTPLVWGTSITVCLIGYLLSPPLLALAIYRGTPGQPFDTMIEIAYKPLEMLYNHAPWYRQYIDFSCAALGV